MAFLIRNNFTGGELSPALHFRPEVTKYQSGLRTCENFLVRPQGGIFSRPGTNYCGTSVSTSNGVRLIPFVFSSTQTYILVFSANRIEIVRDGAFLTAGGFRLQVNTPYTAAQVQELDFAQSADVMTLVHPAHPPKSLSRFGETNWQLANLNFQPMTAEPDGSILTLPFASMTYNYSWKTLGYDIEMDVNSAVNANLSQGQVLTITSAPGMGAWAQGRQMTLLSVTPLSGGTSFRWRALTLGTGQPAPDIPSEEPDPPPETATSGVFTVARAFPVGSGGGGYKKTYRYVVTAVGDNGEESLASQIVSSGSVDSLSVTYGIRLTWSYTGSAAYFRVYKENSLNSGTFGWIGDATTFQFDDYNFAPINADAPPSAFVTPSQPAAVTYYQQRQLFAGMPSSPLSVISSQVGLPTSMRQSRPPRDDDAFETVIASPEFNQIRYLVPLDSLLILTTGAEWRTTEGESEVYTPNTAGVRRVSTNGCAAVKPVVVDDSVLYVQAQGTKLREMAYSFVQDRYGGDDLTIFSDHLFRGRKIKQIAYSAEPDGVLWCVMTDGSLLALTYQKDQEVLAWTRHNLGGFVSSVAVVPENGADVPYFCVQRGSSQYIERLRPSDPLTDEDTLSLDSHLTYSGSPVNQLAGLAHLNGRTVTAVADGVVYSGLTVTGDQVTLPYSASKVVVGLPYTSRAELLPVVGEGVVRGDPKTISRVRAHVLNSRGLFAGVAPYTGGEPQMLEALSRSIDDGYGGQALYTGALEVQTHGSWDTESVLRIEQRDPFPLNVLAVEYQVDVPR